MRTLKTFLLAALLLGDVVAAMPTANAAVMCNEINGGPGLVGRTIEYVGNVEYAACVETLSYAFYLCVVALGPTPCYSIIA